MHFLDSYAVRLVWPMKIKGSEWYVSLRAVLVKSQRSSSPPPPEPHWSSDLEKPHLQGGGTSTTRAFLPNHLRQVILRYKQEINFLVCSALGFQSLVAQIWPSCLHFVYCFQVSSCLFTLAAFSTQNALSSDALNDRILSVTRSHINSLTGSSLSTSLKCPPIHS